MSKQKHITTLETANKQSTDSIKKPIILQDDQLLETNTDDIDEPSSVILPQQDLKISLDLETIPNSV